MILRMNFGVRINSMEGKSPAMKTSYQVRINIFLSRYQLLRFDKSQPSRAVGLYMQKVPNLNERLLESLSKVYLMEC